MECEWGRGMGGAYIGYLVFRYCVSKLQNYFLISKYYFINIWLLKFRNVIV